MTLSLAEPITPITHHWLWPDESQTEAWAARWARALQSPAVQGNALVTLQGDLGAGKTSLVRHLLRACGVTGRIKSPTYAVVEPYAMNAPWGDWSIHHFDLYRFDDPREWIDAGLRDVFAAPGLKLVEWPERAGGQLPVADWALQLTISDDDARDVTLTIATEAGQRLWETMA